MPTLEGNRIGSGAEGLCKGLAELGDALSAGKFDSPIGTAGDGSGTSGIGTISRHAGQQIELTCALHCAVSNVPQRQ